VGQEKATTLGPGGRAVDGAGSGELSFELRQLMSRYPVTLYTSDNCEPCNAGRSQLLARGVPFSERTIKTPADAEALQRLSGAAGVPVLTIGGQRLSGYSSTEWTQYLDAAGYPASSRLPSGYRNPPPSPLVPVPEAPAAAPSPAQDTAVPPPPPPPPSNPSGIVF
jgi:glutaredoxin